MNISDLTVGEMMFYGGIAGFILLFIVLIIMLNVFKYSRKKLAKKIETEFDNE